MPITAVTIFASFYGTMAIGLTCAELFRKQSAAVTTGMAGGRDRDKSGRKKNKSRRRWWQLGRKRRQERGVPEAPQPPQLSTVHSHGRFVYRQPSNPFDGFSAEQPAAHVDIDFRSSDGDETMGSVSQPRGIRPNVQSFSRDYELVRTYRAISQGAVHVVKHRRSGKPFVIKQMPARIRNGHIITPDEADVLMNRFDKHENILGCVGCFGYWDEGIAMVNVIFDYCDAGDVQNFYKAQGAGNVPECFVLHFVSSMIDALAFVHHGHIGYDAERDAILSISHRQPAYLHRDIKPLNIFLQWKPNSKYGLPTIVLGDFGFVQLDGGANGVSYTLNYAAPELLSMIAAGDPNGRQTTASDMYAFGVSIWEVMTGCVYDLGKSNIPAAFRRSSVSKHASILTLLQGCLNPDPAQRPAARDLHRVSAELKAKLQTWYDQGGRLPDNSWPDPFRVEAPKQPKSEIFVHEFSDCDSASSADAKLQPAYCYNHLLDESFDCASVMYPLAEEPKSSSSYVLKGSSNYSRSISASLIRPSPPRPVSELSSVARDLAAESPTIALFPRHIDMTNQMPSLSRQIRTVLSTPDTTEQEQLINLFTGEPATATETDTDEADISSVVVEAGNLGPRDESLSTLSWISSEDDGPLYF